MKKTTLSDVGMAMFHLGTIDKYEKEFDKNPNSFKLRCNISGEILEIPLNGVIKKEITKFFKNRRALNQKLLDENPELVKIIENE